MDALQLFLIEHGRTHAADWATEGPLWLEDVVVSGLTEDQLRRRPTNGRNSLVWLLWHMARIEDVAVNVVLAAGPQVLDQDGWLERLNVTRRDVGSGMQDAEVADFSGRVDIPALRAYRAAVGRRTRELVAGMQSDDLMALVTAADVKRATAAGAFGGQAAWLQPFWEGRTKGWYLSWTGVGHSLLHLGEAMALRGEAGLRGGR